MHTNNRQYKQSKMSCGIRKKPNLRTGKNKKKSWKKCDIAEVEEYLEDKRREERFGDPPKEADELFCFQKSGENISDIPSKIKTLKCHSSIGEFTKIPPPIIINNEPFSKRILNAQFRADEKRRKSSRLRTSQVKKEKENDKITSDLYTADIKDIWGEEEKIDPEIKDFVLYHREITCEKTPKVPLHRYQKPSLLPAVEVPHAGASYNPTYEDHQKLLSKALEVEEIKKREELHLKRVLTDMFPTKAEAPTPESILKEMSQGLFDEDGNEEDETEQPMSQYRNPPVTTENRIPKSRKRRKKEQKEQNRLKKIEQLRKMQLNQVYRIRSIKGEIKHEQEISQQKQDERIQRKIDKMYKPLILSKHKYESPDIEVKLSDEMCDSLRTLKGEGNLLEDRYKSLQRRNLIEPRVTVKRKRKYKLKVQIKRSHRNFQ